MIQRLNTETSDYLRSEPSLKPFFTLADKVNEICDFLNSKEEKCVCAEEAGDNDGNYQSPICKVHDKVEEKEENTWEERFDESIPKDIGTDLLFGYKYREGDTVQTVTDWGEIKSFIKTVEKEAYEKGKKHYEDSHTKSPSVEDLLEIQMTAIELGKEQERARIIDYIKVREEKQYEARTILESLKAELLLGDIIKN